MELISGVVFIGAVVIAVTQLVKELVPSVTGAASIGIAALVGLLVAVVDVYIGVQDLSIAQGLMTGLSAAGVVTVAKKV